MVRTAPGRTEIVEFADFECPHCARFEATVQTIRDKYPDQVAFTFAHFPLSYHDSAESAARAAECAQLQGHFEALRSLLFEKQQAFGEVPWTDFAKQAGVSDVKQFDACMNDTRSLERVEHSKKLGDELGVRGTPAIFVNGWKLPLAPSSEDLDKIVQNVAIGKPPTADVDLFADLARAND